MLGQVLASVLLAAIVQNAAATSARSALTACLRNATAQAKTEKLAVDALVPRLRQTCEADAAKLKSVLVAFDVKNGISRRQAGEDADMQLEEYYLAQEDHYRHDTERSASAN